MKNSWLPGRSGTAAGGLIGMARRQAAMTQAELAEAVGVSQTMISTYELGGREPSLGTLLKILKGAGCSLRMELTPYDDHDDVLERSWIATLGDVSSISTSGRAWPQHKKLFANMTELGTEPTVAALNADKDGATYRPSSGPRSGSRLLDCLRCAG